MAGNSDDYFVPLTVRIEEVRIHRALDFGGKDYHGRPYDYRDLIYEALRQIEWGLGMPIVKAEAQPYRGELDENFSSIIIRWLTDAGPGYRVYTLDFSEGSLSLKPTDQRVEDPRPLTS